MHLLVQYLINKLGDYILFSIITFSFTSKGPLKLKNLSSIIPYSTMDVFIWYKWMCVTMHFGDHRVLKLTKLLKFSSFYNFFYSKCEKLNTCILV